jgi:hypothetical protein
MLLLLLVLFIDDLSHCKSLNCGDEYRLVEFEVFDER